MVRSLKNQKMTLHLVRPFINHWPRQKPPTHDLMTSKTPTCQQSQSAWAQKHEQSQSRKCCSTATRCTASANKHPTSPPYPVTQTSSGSRPPPLPRSTNAVPPASVPRHFSPVGTTRTMQSNIKQQQNAFVEVCIKAHSPLALH